MPALLLEVGMEEIPAGMIARGEVELVRRMEELLRRERMAGASLQVTGYSTPRRLAVVVHDVLPAQPDVAEEIVGPAAKIAFKDGAPAPAAIAFAKKNGVDVSALRTVAMPKGEYVAVTVTRKGQRAADFLAGALPGEIAAIAWPKNMYWRPGKPERFVRPVRWLVALLDREVLSFAFAGVWAGAESRGHRVLHGDAPVVIDAPANYAATLRAAFVEPDPAARRHRIRKALDAAAREVPDARWREDEALVDTVTNLTEWPSVLRGSFEPEYLDLPEEVLVTVMRDHQKYFALEDAAQKLLPGFLTVLNTETDAAGAAIIRHGNERVLRARFNDARFFWNVDQKIPLADRVEMLKSVTFQKDLGSYWEKTVRNTELARTLQELQEVTSSDQVLMNLRKPDGANSIWHAARLAKTDLTTEMVKEFPELQGIVGGLYAKQQGLSDEVADAIYDHYKPVTVQDSIPRSTLGCILALADKTSSIVDMFSVGLEPTGSKDPFALRRAGNGVIKILVENAEIGGRLHLFRLCSVTLNGNPATSDNAKILDSVYDFLLDRFEFYLQESYGLNRQESRAVRNSRVAGQYTLGHEMPTGYGFIAGFARTLHGRTGSSDVMSVAGLLKRTTNILRQARERSVLYIAEEAHTLLHEPAERELSRLVTEAEIKIKESYRAGRYDETIAAIASLQQPLNEFFESVMVMADDPALRENRLALLARTESVVRWAADFSELAAIQTAS